MTNQLSRNLSNDFTIYAEPGDLTEGLFGQVFLHIFEILPWLAENNLHPTWAIRSHQYGVHPGYLVVPNLLDVVMELPCSSTTRISIADVRREHASNLGGDWHYAHQLWSSFFRFPQRIIDRAITFGPLGNALGLHYRGTDKNLDPIQTNPVTEEDFLALVDDFLSNHPEIDVLFIATDQDGFTRSAKARYGSTLTIVDTGKADFWRCLPIVADLRKGDHALLDCMLLSKCRYMLKCQSALSGFSKVLNPELFAYRIAASKLFFYGIPYFPDAYVDRYSSDDPHCRKILHRLFKDDWQNNSDSLKKFGGSFKFLPREEAARSIVPTQTDTHQLRNRLKIRSIIRNLMKLHSDRT